MARKPADAEVLAAILEENAAVVVRALRRGPGASALGALSASLSLEGLAAPATYGLVAAARAYRHTWSEIGQMLRLTRQGAQKRSQRVVAMDGAELAGRPPPWRSCGSGRRVRESRFSSDPTRG
jgi:hypothetical protein